jgi:hypothetical protein
MTEITVERAWRVIDPQRQEEVSMHDEDDVP